MSSVPALKPCKIIPCSKAEDLLSEIDSRGTNFRDTFRPNHWMFRGQENAGWKMLPSAFRPAIHGFTGLPAHGHTNGDQIRMEVEGLCKFFHSADRSGLPLPEDSQDTRKLLRDIRNTLGPPPSSTHCGWPTDKLLSLMALAQHNGIPTRLLDWTWDAKISAYFAAVQAAKQIKSSNGISPGHSGLICVWAMSLEHIEPDAAGIRQRNHETADTGFSLVTAPSAGNPNLRAQRGVFLLHRSATKIELGKNFECKPIEEKLAGTPLQLLQFTLPAIETPRLLRLLARDGVSGAALFPSYEGAAKAAQEELWWDAPK